MKLILKQKRSLILSRTQNHWLKVKQASEVLTLLFYMLAGSGKRGGSSDFTLGVSVKEDARYEEEFIPIGKAYGGYRSRMEAIKQIY